MKKKIFPFEIKDTKINLSKKNFQEFNNLILNLEQLNIKLKSDEIEFILKYKTFVNYDNIYSMSDSKKIIQVENILKNILKNNIDGDIVEAGVWKGGMSMWIKSILKYYNSDKKLWLLDVWDIFPKSNNKKDIFIDPIIQFLYKNPPSINDVINNFKKFNLFDKNVLLIQSDFNIYLYPINKIAMLRIDCDYYDSILSILEKYYWNIVSGGYIIVDDYKNKYVGCYQAIKYFRNKYNINNKIIEDLSDSIYWII